MSKKFHLPQKLIQTQDISRIINWYKDKLLRMENRQKRLSKLLSKLKFLKKEYNEPR